MRVSVSFGVVSLLLVFGLDQSIGYAQDKPRDLLIGKWLLLDSKDKTTLEFTKDGKTSGSTIRSGKELKSTGTFKFLADDKIEVTSEVLGKKLTNNVTFKVTNDELTTTNDLGRTDKYKRTK